MHVRLTMAESCDRKSTQNKKKRSRKKNAEIILHKEVNGQDMRRLNELVDSGGAGSDGLMTNQEVFQRPIARAAYQMRTHSTQQLRVIPTPGSLYGISLIIFNTHSV